MTGMVVVPTHKPALGNGNKSTAYPRGAKLKRHE
jgi:hypothetical protein